jgi:uncharacterized membrane protein YfcA
MAVNPELLWLLCALLAGGFVSGMLAGLFGVGGGGIMVSVLYELFRTVGVPDEIRMHLAVGTSLAIIIPTGFRSFRSHQKRGAVNMDIMWHLGPSVVAGVLAGVFISKVANAETLKIVFAASMTLMAVKLLAGTDRWQLGIHLPPHPVGVLAGVFIGVISTLIGIGGGVYVSSYMTLYGRSLHHAVATSSGFGPIIAVPAMLGYMWAGWHSNGLPPGSLGYVSGVGALLVMPVSVLAAPVGVRLAHGISRRTLEIAFAGFLILMAVRFFISLLP